eukprot:986690-Pleurochrysis_carterae.AAC.1
MQAKMRAELALSTARWRGRSTKRATRGGVRQVRAKVPIGASAKRTRTGPGQKRREVPTGLCAHRAHDRGRRRAGGPLAVEDARIPDRKAGGALLVLRHRNFVSPKSSRPGACPFGRSVQVSNGSHALRSTVRSV